MEQSRKLFIDKDGAITFLNKEIIKKMTGVRFLWGSPEITEGNVILNVRLRDRGSGREFMFHAVF